MWVGQGCAHYALLVLSIKESDVISSCAGAEAVRMCCWPCPLLSHANPFKLPEDSYTDASTSDHAPQLPFSTRAATQLGFSRKFEDCALDAAASVRLPEPARVTKLRLDVGWKFWGKTPEDEIENTAVEFAVKFYNAAVGGGVHADGQVVCMCQLAIVLEEAVAGLAVGTRTRSSSKLGTMLSCAL